MRVVNHKQGQDKAFPRARQWRALLGAHTLMYGDTLLPHVPASFVVLGYALLEKAFRLARFPRLERFW